MGRGETMRPIPATLGSRSFRSSGGASDSTAGVVGCRLGSAWPLPRRGRGSLAGAGESVCPVYGSDGTEPGKSRLQTFFLLRFTHKSFCVCVYEPCPPARSDLPVRQPGSCDSPGAGSWCPAVRPAGPVHAADRIVLLRVSRAGPGAGWPGPVSRSGDHQQRLAMIAMIAMTPSRTSR